MLRRSGDEEQSLPSPETERRRETPVATKTKRLKKNRGESERGVKTWELRLYVAGQTSKSMAAFSNLKKLCEGHLHGQYRIEVIDLFSNPALAKGDQIFAIPP